MFFFPFFSFFFVGAIDDFDKYQSSNVDTGKHEDTASNDREAMAPSETRPVQPEVNIYIS